MRKLSSLAGLLLLLLLFCLPLFSSAQQYAKRIKYGGDKIGFYEHLPSSYKTDGGNTTYPLLIFLHGVGERGNGTSDLWKVKRIAVPQYIDKGNPMRFYVNGKWHSFIVLSPQCPSKYYMWPSFYVEGLIQYAQNNLRVDKSRIYLIGLSMGGGGTWRYASESLQNAKKLAAIATTSAPPFMTNACNVAAANLPMYAFHAKNDRVVNIAALRKTVNAVLACKPAIKPLAKIYSGGGHNIFNWSFNVGHDYQSPNVYEWLLGYTRGASSSKPPPTVEAPIPGKPNKAPIAATGRDQVIQTFWNFSPLLDGTNSKDSDGWIKSVVWTKIYGPSSYRFTQQNKIQTRVTNLVRGKYIFRLTITDDKGAVSWANTTLVVNTAPEINIIGPKTVQLPLRYALLLGTPTTDHGGWVTSWRWSKIAGPSTYRMTGANTAAARFYDLVAGTYTFRLWVADNEGGTAYKDYTLKVKNKVRYSVQSDDIIINPEVEDELQLSGEKVVPNSVSIYPNPVVSTINVTIEGVKRGRAVLSVYDISGKIIKNIVYQKDQQVLTRSVDVSALAPGTYVLVAVVENEILSTEQFIKQ